LVGTYDIEILTLPKLKMVLDVEQSKNSIIQIPAPGLVGFKNPGKGFGSICRKIDGRIDLVYSFLPDSKNKTIELQPGKYVYIFRGQSRQRAFYTVEKDFTIISGKSTVVQF
jgi:Ca-activated chloride channel family protein